MDSELAAGLGIRLKWTPPAIAAAWIPRRLCYRFAGLPWASFDHVTLALGGVIRLEPLLLFGGLPSADVAVEGGEGRGEDRSPGVSHRRSGIRREGEQE